MTVKEKEKGNDILNNEIESWKGFESALRELNSLLFNKMLTDCQDNKEYSKAVEVRGESHSAELFMAFIFQEQQKCPLHTMVTHPVLG
ncbi:MAG TPA: hypothetical protein VIP70_05040 [Nitrososphaeraceae archaeon]